jgi:hypothetical protein
LTQEKNLDREVSVVNVCLDLLADSQRDSTRFERDPASGRFHNADAGALRVEDYAAADNL